MVMARRSGTVVDQAGNIVTNAKIEVRRETPGQPLAALKSDRVGLVGMSNPFDADADGSFAFHVIGGAYQIRAYVGPSGAPTFEAPIERYVGIGLASETDSASGASTSDDVSNESDVAGATVTDALNTLKAGQREVLTGNRMYYAAPSGSGGSDSNDGLTALTPFLTPQKAWDTILKLDLFGFVATIQIADGTYTAGISSAFAPVGGTVVIQGNSGTPANVLISTTSAHSFNFSGLPKNVTIKDLKVQTTTSGIGIRAADKGVTVSFSNVNFGACATQHVQVASGGTVSAIGNYSITGGSVNHVRADGAGSQFNGSTITVTLTGTPNFTQSFTWGFSSSVQNWFNWTFSGSATGTRYLVESNAVVNTFGGGASYFPGNAAGSGTNSGASPYGLYL